MYNISLKNKIMKTNTSDYLFVTTIMNYPTGTQFIYIQKWSGCVNL